MESSTKANLNEGSCKNKAGKKAISIKEKVFKCDICDAQLKCKENLIIHKRIHTKEKPFQCIVCDVKVSCISNLKSHMITHKNEKLLS